MANSQWSMAAVFTVISFFVKKKNLHSGKTIRQNPAVNKIAHNRKPTMDYR